MMLLLPAADSVLKLVVVLVRMVLVRMAVGVRRAIGVGVRVVM
jgi:hypothetical protein